eukprot:gene6019-3052_t
MHQLILHEGYNVQHSYIDFDDCSDFRYIDFDDCSDFDGSMTTGSAAALVRAGCSLPSDGAVTLSALCSPAAAQLGTSPLFPAKAGDVRDVPLLPPHLASDVPLSPLNLSPLQIARDNEYLET